MHRVSMRFVKSFLKWRVTFTPMDGNHKLREFVFSSSEKIEELATRAGGLTDLAAKQALELGIQKGRGAIMLKLNSMQYAKLAR